MLKGKFKSPLYFSVVLLVLLSLALILASEGLTTSKREGSYDHSQKIAYFHGSKFVVPEEITQPSLGYNVFPDQDKNIPSNVLGSQSNREKRIEVDLTNQKLYAYEGSKKIMSFDVSTGKWAETPTGEFRIWTKLKYTLMTGGSREIGTYYYLPNVPYTMYFYKDYGIHGAYWHNNFGHPMSHGCVNMRTTDAEKLFYWANPVLPEKYNSVLAAKGNEGTRVIIYGTTPKE